MADDPDGFFEHAFDFSQAFEGFLDASFFDDEDERSVLLDAVFDLCAGGVLKKGDVFYCLAGELHFFYSKPRALIENGFLQRTPSSTLFCSSSVSSAPVFLA